MRRWMLVLLGCAVFGSATAAEKSVWTVVARCSSVADAAPVRGLFEVRYKTRGGEAEAIEVRGCGKNRAFRKIFEWGGDEVHVDFYALPFFEKGKLDFLIELGWDDSVDFKLLRASSDYAVAVEFSAVDAPFFGDADRDGRWEIRIENLIELKCGNDRAWGADLLKVGQAHLSADTLCKTDPSPPSPKL